MKGKRQKRGEKESRGKEKVEKRLGQHKPRRAQVEKTT